MTAAVALSRLDQERFGVAVARCSNVTEKDVAGVVEFCRVNAVQMLVVRCDAADLGAVHAIEACGGRLMDTLVYFARDLVRSDLPDERGPVTIREASPADADAVRRVAEESFRGYLGHYHADPRLPRGQCDEAYADWAYRSCLSREIAEVVLVAEDGSGPFGFITLRLNDPEEAEVVLNGVTPARQRGGVYRSLLVSALRWASSRRASRVLISTQVTNVPVQKAWVRLGFEPIRSFYTLHVWFDG